MKFKFFSVTMAALFVAACGADGATGPQGEQGPAGPPGTNTTNDDTTNPSTNAVIPASGFLGRELDVQIGLTGGELNAAPKVDFGKGITVTDVKLASPTLVTAHITIASNAEAGAHDVTVGDLVAKGAFKVTPSLDVTEAVKAQQGGLGAYLVNNLDSFVFDTADGAFLLDAGEGLLTYSAGATGAYAAQGIFLAPPLAKTGGFQLAAHNLDATGNPVISFFGNPDGPKVTAREPEALTLGTPKNGETFAAAWGSKLYKLSTAADSSSVLVFNLHVETGEETSLNGILWGSGGTAKDLLGLVQPPVDQYGFPLAPPYDINISFPVTGAARSFFFSALDVSGASGTKFNFAPEAVSATLVPEGTDAHGTEATAQVFTAAAPGAANVITGEIKGDERDWYKLTVAADEIIELSIDSGAANLEAVVRKTGSTNDLGWTTGGVSGKYQLQPTSALAAGEYFISVGAALGETTSVTGKYTVGVRRIASH